MKSQHTSIEGTMSDKLRVKDAAKFFGVSESFLRHSLMKRQIPGYRLAGAVFVSRSEIESMIANNKI